MQMNMVQAINEALRSAMRRDKRVVVLGDVGVVDGEAQRPGARLGDGDVA